MDFNNLEYSFAKLKNHLDQLSKWKTTDIHQLDIDYLKKLTQRFYGDIIDMEANTVHSKAESKKNTLSERKPEEKVAEQIASVTPTPAPAPVEPVLPVVEKIVPDVQDEKTARETYKSDEVKKPLEVPVLKTEPAPTASEPVTVPNDPVDVINPSTQELFNIPAGSDLSAILRNRKIEHIGKSMGFNEKIFTINELFNGDRELFDQTIEQLNNLSSFEDAKSYLMDNVVKTHDWSSKKKLKSAQTFIRHISRKYQGVEA